MIDFEGINRAALANGRTVVQRIIPGGKFRSIEYIVRNPRRNDQNPGSFKINYKTGEWADFAIGEKGGDIISFAAYVWDTSQSEAGCKLADILGMPASRPNGLAYSTRAPKPKGADSNCSKATGSEADATTGAPIKIYPWGDAGPPKWSNEERRHTFRHERRPVRVKIKLRNGEYVNCYRLDNDDWQLKKPDNYQPVPYVGEAINPFDPELDNDQIFWPEGEKDVDTLSKLGLPAITFGGTGDGLPDGIEHYLRDRRIAILADNDDPGRKHAKDKATRAQAAGATSIRVIQFPELPPKGDVSDSLNAGGTAELLYVWIDAAPEWTPPVDSEQAVGGPSLVMQRACDIEMKPVEWLWPRRMAIGKQTMLAGEPGLGKSQLCAFLAATVTTGGYWPNGEGRAEPGSVIVLSTEDDPVDTIIPRLKAAGADLSRVHIVSAVTTDDQGRRLFNLQSDLAALEEAIARVGDVRLVIIDPVSSYLGRVDSHKNAEVRTVLEPIGETASRVRVAVVAVTHFSKDGGTSANNRFIGSIAFVAAARAAFIVSRDPEDKNRRLFVPSKNNLGPDRDGLAFRIETRDVGQGIIAPAVSWDSEPVTRTADEILAALGEGRRDQSATEEAVAWLRELLADGPLPATQVQSEADAAAHSWATIRRAKKALGVEAFREGGMAEAGRWLWRLPAVESLRCSTTPYPAQELNVSALGRVEPLSRGAAPSSGDLQ